ncbi:protein FAM227B-like [Narcine bancroftii]|uniref:protein FAM227B-like n=1 Tax=Narcine bancroftii TaxID=1343680 RepID=UPI003831A9F3
MWNMENLPKTYEEFLQFQDLKDWPELLPDEDQFNLMIQPDLFTSYESLSQYVNEHAPFPVELLIAVEQRVDQFQSHLEKYSSKILPDEPRKSKAKEHNLPPSLATTVRQMKDSDVLLTHPSRKLSEEFYLERKERSVETQTFPGFKPLQFIKLPGQMEPLQILNWIRKIQKFNLGFQNTWKKLILSEPSAAILQDAFWWFFLYKFKPSREDQDHLFSRIADSFVSLFMIAPVEVQDKFFQVYPDCISQAIFAVFYKSFPGSHTKFSDEFKSELTELISLWMTGLRPEEFSWRKWNLQWLENLMSRRVPERKENILAEKDLKATTFRFRFDLDEEISSECHLTKRDPSIPKPTATFRKMETSCAGSSPEFRHILFRFSGRSPLVTHFLNMNKIMGRSLGTMGPKMKHTEITKDSPLCPIYKDIIKEAQKFSKDLHQKNINLHKQTQKAIAKLRWDQIQFNKKIDRLKKELSSNKDALEQTTTIIPSKLNVVEPGNEWKKSNSPKVEKILTQE